ncbi:hypothetical protein N7523_010228 [Penicillium sp. IBT 18751x]|nr:hypothetical protein N7523_010228 [Penicillium sp. IBT 18751x]
MTYNQFNRMGFNNRSQGYVVNDEMFAEQMKCENVHFDFNTAPARNPPEMDVDSGSVDNTSYFSANSGKS